jgi:lipid II isoglutaminyl synthase (glutamine-hydrolysing)
LNKLALLLGKFIISISKTLNLGSGSTWPGHIALKINKNFIKDILKNSKTKIVIIAGTNGKTTTARLVTSIIRENGKTYLQNKAGANLVNGLASTLIYGTGLDGKLHRDYLIFESDEYALPQVLKETNPDYLICLNLFRDQLDRYGETASIAKKWQEVFKMLSSKTMIILNSDDPQIASLSTNSNEKTFYFGLPKQNNKNVLKHGADSIYCPDCFSELVFDSITFSHLGIWKCPKCGLKRPIPDLTTIPFYPLHGTYNKYNANAAALFGLKENYIQETITKAFKSFTPAFGRQEKLVYKDKKIQLFLSKNPTSFNESLDTIKELKGENILILLNDQIPDGLDVSWIWDINFEDILTKDINIGVSGERVYDMALRLKYGGFYTHIFENLQTGLDQMIENIKENETLYILPNYSSMLEIRKIITGRKIL